MYTALMVFATDLNKITNLTERVGVINAFLEFLRNSGKILTQKEMMAFYENAILPLRSFGCRLSYGEDETLIGVYIPGSESNNEETDNGSLCVDVIE